VTDTQMWALIVGVLLPPVVAAVQQPGFPTWLRSVIAVAASAVAGFVTVLVTGQLGGRSVVTAVLLTLVAAVSSYESVWKPTGIAPRVEAATSPRRHQPPSDGPPMLGTPNPMPRGTTRP
jgi:hypothetical protein